MMILGDAISNSVTIARSDLNGNGSDCYSDFDVTSQFLSHTMTPIDISVFQSYDSFVDFIPILSDLQLHEEPGCVYDYIHEKESKKTLKLIPNPAVGSFKIETDNQNYNDFKYLDIRDISGRMVFQTKDKACLNGEINTSQIRPGIYHVSLMTNTHCFTSRLVIVR